MTTEESIKYNKLIAEFGNWTYHEDKTRSKRWKKWWATDGISYAGENPPSFEADWNLLMPVWAKLRLTVWENLNGYPKEFMLYVENFKTACFNNSIGDARNAVFDGIHWYSKQKPETS